MAFTQDQIDELKAICAEVEEGEEGGVTLFLLEGLSLPSGCRPAKTDALLWPVERDGYASRLFFAEQITCAGKSFNWNISGALILQKKWWAFSWRTIKGLRLVQMVAEHLRAFR